MRKSIYILMVVALSLISCKQGSNRPIFNLDFEQTEMGNPAGWINHGTSEYSASLDSTVTYSGKYSVSIEHTGGDFGYKSWGFPFTDIYDGKQITLSGYIKTEDVTDGCAGLYMRIDPYISIEEKPRQGITGTTDWTKYEITLDMDPSKTRQTLVGGVLYGKGKMWLDNLSISIDGKDIRELQPLELTKIIEGKTYPAEMDKEFDKGSGIVFPELDNRQVDNLELLGKLWGFLKYHHPAIALGNYNWDYELFRILPDYLKVKDDEERDVVLLRWIKKYGKIPARKPFRDAPADAIQKLDLNWVEKSNMNGELKEKINDIYKNRNQGEQYYVKSDIGGVPDFLNEKSYHSMSFPDAGFRLLALYRYWNIIQYFFPYKYLCDKDWNDVLKEHIYRFVSAPDELGYEQAVLLLIVDTNDTHAQLLEGHDKIYEWKGQLYAPFRVQFIEGKLVVTDYYNSEYKEEAGLQVGDIITHIDGKSIDSIVDSIKQYYPMSNDAAGLRDISGDLLRSDDRYLDLQYVSSGQVKQRSVNLYPSSKIYSSEYNRYKGITDIPCYKLINENIGYISLATIRYEDVAHIKKEFLNTKGIIIDIRNYPSASIHYSLGSFFVSDVTPFVKPSTGSTNNPGEFILRETENIPKTGETYEGQVVVLVNEETQSHAEFTAMAFRAGKNTLVVGSPTAGADGNCPNFFLPGGIKTWISMIGIYYPDGTETQRIGIVPDIIVKPTIKGIKEGRDEVLEKAIEILSQRM